MACLGIDRREQCELLTTLGDGGFIHQNDSRQLGGETLTSLSEALTELLDPLPDRHIRPLEADPAKNARHFPQAHTVIVQQDCQLNEVALSPLTLDKFNFVQHFSQFGKVILISSSRSRIFPSLSLS